MKELHTARLRLRRITPEDTERIFECWGSDAEVCRYLTWLLHDSVEVTRRIMEGWMQDYAREDCCRYGIEEKETGELIGMIDVVHVLEGQPVIGYVLGRAFWNRGYMTEAFAALVEELFAQGYPGILIAADERNIGSNAVIRKNGFTFLRKETGPCSRFKPEVVTLNWYQKKAPRSAMPE